VTAGAEPAQQRAARVAGFLYVLQMATAIFGETYVRGGLLVRGDAVQTAKNIAASQRLFRVGIAADLITVAVVVTLLWALYVILEPVNRRLALLAAFFRLIENAVIAAAAFNAFSVLRVLAATDYLTAFDSSQLAVLARLFIGAQGSGLRIGFIFCGLGSAVFSYVWLQSRYIPRAFAMWGIFASLLLAIVTLANMVLPALGDALGMTDMAPMFIYEVGLGIWLMVKGLRAA
jgi:hypothetical protein